MSTITIGVDLAKSTFSTCEVDDTGRVLRRLDCKRDTFAAWLAQLPVGVIVAMEACSGAHHWARRCLEYGLTPRLMAAQFVRPFRKNPLAKNDPNDAEAIAIANRLRGLLAEFGIVLAHRDAKHRGRFQTITADNGTEFHDYKRIEEQTGVCFYFANPHHSWERGTNEHTNGPIRQYLPKGMNMDEVTQQDCSLIAHGLNHRPRKRLGFKDPEECFNED